MDFDDLLMVAVKLLEALRRASGRLPGAVQAHLGRRVPGHQPGPEPARHPARRGARQRVRGRRLRPVRLPLARRRHPQHLAVRAGVRPTPRRSCSSRTTARPRRILDAANAVIAHNQARRPKRLFTEGDEGPPIARYRAEDEHDEASWVASEIVRLHDREALSYADVAVFYRTNAQSRVLEEELVRRAIPYKVVGGTRFYDRREVKDMLAYVRLLANPTDEVSARRIAERAQAGHRATRRSPGWSPGRTTNGTAFPDALAHAEEAGLTGKALKGAPRAGRAPRRAAARWPTPSRPATWSRRWPTAPGTWPSWRPSAATRPTGGSRTSSSWPGWPPSTRTCPSSWRRWPWWPTPTSSTATAPGSSS